MVAEATGITAPLETNSDTNKETNMHRYVHVRHRHDYGEFFVRELAPVSRVNGEGIVYAATFCCYSSFGVYGYHWSHMGEPFAEFIAGIKPDYLLSKIAERVFDDETCLKSVRDEVVRMRREQSRGVSKDAAREAWDAIDDIAADYSGESLATALYECSELSVIRLEYCDLTCRAWDRQAVAFVERLWPEFVKQYATDVASAAR